jgi:hypothetical protein
LRSFWSVTVRANWRIVFRFEGEDAFEVELTDYQGEDTYDYEKSTTSRTQYSERLP